MLDIGAMKFTETPHRATTKSGRKGRETGDVLIHGELRFESTTRVAGNLAKSGSCDAAKRLIKRAIWRECYDELRDLAMELHGEISHVANSVNPDSVSVHRAERLADTLVKRLAFPREEDVE